MVLSVRQTGYPRMDSLDDKMARAEKLLSRVSCYVITAPPAGITKIIMGIFQAAIGTGGALYAMIKSDNLLKERFVTQIKNGLANCVRGTLETVPFVGLGLFIREDLIKTSGLFDCYFVSCKPSFKDDVAVIRYPSIQLRTWEIIACNGERFDKTLAFTLELEEKFKRKIEEANNPTSLHERVNILDRVFAAFNAREDTDIFVGQVTRPDGNSVRKQRFITYKHV